MPIQFVSSVRPYDAQEREIERKRQQAQVLRQQAAQFQEPIGQNVSGHFVAKNPLSYAADLLRNYSAGRTQRDADQEQKDLIERRKTEGASVAQALRGEQPIEALGNLADNELAQSYSNQLRLQQLTGNTSEQPSLVREYQFAVQNGFKGSFPEYAQSKTGGNQPSAVQEYEYFNKLSPEDRAKYLTVKRSAQMVNLGGTYGVINPVDPNQLSSQFAVTPKPEQMPEFQANVAGQKAAATSGVEAEVKETEKNEAKTIVTTTLKEAVNLYDKLDKQGAAINTENDALQNISASLGASKAGQKVGNFLGTEAQSIRNQINQLRPTLLNSIRKATDMGAKGLDSEKELEFYLQAVSDPSRDIQSNKAALKVLNDNYGLGTGLDVSDTEVQKIKKEAKSVSQDDGWSVEEVP